jgi:hypothetical protein
MHHPRLALAAALLATASLVACGSSEKNSTGDTTGSSAAPSTTAATGGKGKGTVTLAGTDYAFAASTCTIGGEKDATEIVGKGTAGGKAFDVEINRYPDPGSTIETVSVKTSGLSGSVATHIASDADPAVLVGKDGKLTGTMTFDGTGGMPSGEGTVTVTCDS